MRLLLVVALATLSCAAVPSAEPDPQPAGQRVVGYFVEWGIYQRNYHVASIPGDRLTHINYAFAKVSPQGEVGLFDSFAAIDKAYPGDKWDPPTTLRGNFNQLALLKKKHPHLKTLISVGGWTLSGPFSDVAATPETRARCAKSCAAFASKYGFDGVDIDWEYPVGGGLEGNKVRPEDRANYPLLLAEIRKELDAQGKKDSKRYLLTIAAPAGPKIIAHFDLAAITPHLDWYNLMAYDFHGGWDKQTGFNAPLYPDPKDPRADETIRKQFNVDAAVKAYLTAGVPADKLVLGVPFYGRGWGGVKDANDGLYQPASGPAPRGTWEPGVWDWKDLANNHVNKLTPNRHPDARVPWLFDPKTGVMISYDDPTSIRAKAEYIVKHKLGGAMIWELSADDPKVSLLEALDGVLRPGKKSP
jgi:chitinase